MEAIKNIILIDDDEAIYHTIRIVLGKPEYDLVYFKDTVSAMQHLKKTRSKIDLIILDIMMPDQSGLEFLDALGNRKSTIPVIVISAINTARAAVEAIKKGASDYLTKPFTLDDIKGMIRTHLKTPESTKAAK
ncbi:MAG: response regulator [Nitrospirae bacterium]|nr:response regulator [Nitrospirota bacterium]MCL5238514.1 response regulator [Nitrospirota bacterium]